MAKVDVVLTVGSLFITSTIGSLNSLARDVFVMTKEWLFPFVRTVPPDNSVPNRNTTIPYLDLFGAKTCTNIYLSVDIIDFENCKQFFKS